MKCCTFIYVGMYRQGRKVVVTLSNCHTERNVRTCHSNSVCHVTSFTVLGVLPYVCVVRKNSVIWQLRLSTVFNFYSNWSLIVSENYDMNEQFIDVIFCYGFC